MTQEQGLQRAVEELLFFSAAKGLIEQEDISFSRNLLLDILKLDAPGEPVTAMDVPETATPFLEKLADAAIKTGILDDTSTDRELFTARLMGCVTPSPKAVREEFQKRREENGPQAATAWFYQLCRDCDYIRVDQIAKNIRYFANTACGELEITINLSKPEKDPREIAKLKSAPKSGYPKCMLCVENPGYAGRLNFPARQNHRIVPLTLHGARWYLQYSPYLYYPEHCIVLNGEHVPMVLSRGSFDRLFDFADQFPHYFIGSNADLPIVGGSILNHDHFQGGNYVFPMERARDVCALMAPAGIRAAVMDWPMSAISLRGEDREALISLAVKVLGVWREYSDPKRDILARTTEPHNTVTPILRREGKGYRLMLVLRNNRTTKEHPLGLFHPHAPLHPVKKENIGLIEVMGLFILPGRLKEELSLLESYLTGEKPLVRPAEDDPACKHFAWLTELASRSGTALATEDARQALRAAVGDICCQVLKDSGVFKQTADGLDGMLAFLETVGLKKALG
jgi:UDPglucose--hexose-1-phosphate uridylyltransferase